MLIIILYLALAILVLFLFNRLTCGMCKRSSCLIGKTAIVTGGNAGIGYEVAHALAERGCRVIIADKDNAESSRKKIIKETNNPNIITKYLNLASFKSVREFCEEINKSEKAVHILVNNAGVGNCMPQVTEDGLNSTLQINHYGPFLLTHLLVDVLKRSSPSRIIFTSSILAFVNNLDAENMNLKQCVSYSGSYAIYGNSKLCSLITANGFSKRLEGTGVTCNSLHPGAVRTNIFRKAVSHGRYIDEFAIFISTTVNYLIGKNAWEGAQTSIHLSTSHEVENVTGKHFWDCKPFPFLPAKAKDEDVCTMVWTKSEEFVHLKESERLKII